MRIGSVPDPTHCLLLMLASARREPALLRRPMQRSWAPGPEGFLEFCNAAAAPVVPEEKMAEALSD
jgi:hypothetical protein